MPTKYKARIDSFAGGVQRLAIADLLTGNDSAWEILPATGGAAASILQDEGLALEDIGFSTANPDSVNSALLASVFAYVKSLGGGLVTLNQPGSYSVNAWPTNPDVSVTTTVQLGSGVSLTDGGSTVNGPITLRAGMWPTVRVVNDAVSNTTTTVTSATAAFVANDIGKTIVIKDTSGNNANSTRRTIAAVVGPTQITLNAATTFTANNCSLAIGTQCGAAASALLTENNNKAYAVTVLPAGVFMIDAQLDVAQGGALVGAGAPDPGGIAGSAMFHIPTRGTVLVWTGTFGTSYFVQLGSAATFGQAMGGTTLRGICLEGSFYVNANVLNTGWGSYIERNSMQSAIQNNMSLGGNTLTVRDNFCNGWQGLDNVVLSAGDSLFSGNLLRGCGSGKAQLFVYGSYATRIVGNHCFASDTTACNNIQVTYDNGAAANNLVIAQNELEVCLGHHIKVNLFNAGTILYGLSVTDNQFYHTAAITDNTYDCVNTVAGAGTKLRGTKIHGNNAVMLGATNYRSVWGDEGAVAAVGTSMQSNIGSACKGVFAATKTAPTTSSGNLISDNATRDTYVAS